MDQKSRYHLKNLLKELVANQGYFILACGDYYCQLAKGRPDSHLRIEAVSHYFNKAMDKGAENAFNTLGFTLAKNENYSKEVIIRSGADIEIIVQEIDSVMENIYRCNSAAEIVFTEDIEYTS